MVGFLYRGTRFALYMVVPLFERKPKKSLKIFLKNHRFGIGFAK